MLRTEKIFKINDKENFRMKSLFWASRFSVFTYLNHNNITFPYGAFPEVLAAGAIDFILPEKGNSFNELKQFSDAKNDFLFGFISYDIKNEIENLTSNNPDIINFPDLYFYQPKHLIHFREDHLLIQSIEDPEKLFSEINSLTIPFFAAKRVSGIKQNMSKEEYFKNIERIKQHLSEGDIYELNYCVDFFSENAEIDPIGIYLELIKNSPMPFSAFHKQNDKYLICASPERFLKKLNRNLISQPIKGTSKRGSNETEDIKLKEQLQNSPKERSENMMIVDLVRNDLARSSVPGSVKVEEIFGIYSFRQVHQMISTVISELKENVHAVDAIKNAFPMGSMTGAPKIKAMELIEKYEKSKRGLFSGAIGYIGSDGDFDFNVIIRSILYNQSERYLSFQAGSAITYLSDAEDEYQECLLKAQAMLSIFKH